MRWRNRVRTFWAGDGSWSLEFLGDPDWRLLFSLGPTLWDSGWCLVRRGRAAHCGGPWAWF